MKTLFLVFNFDLNPFHIYDFRGALIDYARHFYKEGKLTKEEFELFANKDEGTRQLKNTYARIQYRSIHHEACIWAVNEGADAVEKLIQTDKKQNRKYIKSFSVQRSKPFDLEIKLFEKEQPKPPAYSKAEQYYVLHQLVPFDVKTEKTLKQDFIARIQELQHRLENELILFCTQFGSKFNFEKKPVKVTLIDVSSRNGGIFKTKDKETGKAKEVPITYYFVKFKTNLTLPENISLGRHKAYGYGRLEHSHSY